MIFALWFPVKVSKAGFPSECVLWIKIYLLRLSDIKLQSVGWLEFFISEGTLLKSD